MDRYFQKSQEIKASLERSGALKESILESLAGEPINDIGNSHILYRIKVNISHFVAIRAFKVNADYDHIQSDLEYCARSYARHVNSGYRVPSFSIGAYLSCGKPILLTEDLTEGGSKKLYHSDTHGGYLHPGCVDVLFDFGLEHVDVAKVPEIKTQLLKEPLYFDRKHVIEVK